MKEHFRSPPTALSIAGSDNSAGAGIQADLKTFSSLGVYGLTALTCVVSEVPGKVISVQPIQTKIVTEQIALCLENFSVGAIKTGMVYSAEIAGVIVDCLREGGKNIPLVVDPVMVATAGERLLQNDALEILQSKLFPMANLITPNLDEAQLLVGREISNVAEMIASGKELAARFGTAFLMKGGHLAGESAIDVLVQNGEVLRFESPFIKDVSTHGTGCTYSSAIAAHLALGFDMATAVERSKRYITAAIQGSLRWRKNVNLQTTALNHFHGTRGCKHTVE